MGLGCASFGDEAASRACPEAHPHNLALRLDSCHAIYATNLLEAEVASGLSRRRIIDDGSLGERLVWVLPDRTLSREIEQVLAVGDLRGADLWQVACALYLSPDPRELTFLTLDERQAEVARAAGFAG